MIYRQFPEFGANWEDFPKESIPTISPDSAVLTRVFLQLQLIFLRQAEIYSNLCFEKGRYDFNPVSKDTG